MTEDRPIVAVLGTGLMGTGIVRSLLRAGLGVRVWNRTPAKARALAEEGAVFCGSPAAAADSADVLLTMLIDGPTTERTVVEGGALAALREGAVWMQCGTVGVEGDRLAEIAARHGVPFYDAPVLGTPRTAQEGHLGIIASGPVGSRDRVQPVLDAISFQALWLGEGTEANRLKLAISSWILSGTLAVAEAIALTESLGVDPALFLKAIEGGRLDTRYARMKGEAIITRRLDPDLTVETAIKDATLITKAGRDAGASPRVAEAVLEQYLRAAELGHGGDDLCAAYFAATAPRP